VPLLERYTLPGRHRHHLLIAHTALGCRDFYLGRHAQARRHVRIAIENYDAAEHAEVARVYGGDGGINCHLYLLWTLWISGLPDQAMSAYERAIELAERTGDPLAIAGTLSFGVALHQHCRRVSEVEHIAERLVRLCVERHLPFYLAMGTCAKGWVAAQRDELDAGLAKLDRGLAILEATGARTSSPYWRSLRVEAHLRGGQLEEGLRVVDEALAVSKQTLDRFYAPELHRLRGELRRRGGSGQEALSLFQQALAEARDDGARSLELRAATSLFRLWRDRGEGGRGREILSEAYASFTEGFGTGDLLEARALLEGGS
jgi:predicted ATPase